MNQSRSLSDLSVSELRKVLKLKEKIGTLETQLKAVLGAPLAMAGISEWWRDKKGPAGAPPIYSCSIITTTASQDMDGIHDRMPVILNPDTFDVWLDPDVEDLSELTALVHAAPAGTIVHHPVSPRVGNVRNNDADLVASV